MRSLFGWVSNRWANYKYRFTPWIALNIDREAVKLDFELASPQVLLQQLHKMLEELQHYTALRDDLMLYDELHQRNQVWSIICWIISPITVAPRSVCLIALVSACRDVQALCRELAVGSS